MSLVFKLDSHLTTRFHVFFSSAAEHFCRKCLNHSQSQPSSWQIFCFFILMLKLISNYGARILPGPSFMLFSSPLFDWVGQNRGSGKTTTVTFNRRYLSCRLRRGWGVWGVWFSQDVSTVKSRVNTMTHVVSTHTCTNQIKETVIVINSSSDVWLTVDEVWSPLLSSPLLSSPPSPSSPPQMLRPFVEGH